MTEPLLVNLDTTRTRSSEEDRKEEAVVLALSPRLGLLLVGRIYRHSKILALEPPTTRRTALHLLGIGLAGFEVIEEHPLVLAFHPPELPPELVPPRARTI